MTKLHHVLFCFLRSKILNLILFSLIISQTLLAQTFSLNNAKSSLNVTGSSNLHDWRIEGMLFNGAGVFIIENDHFKTISELTFNVIVDRLKASKVAMNKSIQIALKAKLYPTINFKLEKLNRLTEIGFQTYTAESSGQLTIAGVTKPIDLIFDISVLNSKVRIEGIKYLKMTDFNIKPPTALLGMLKTGDSVKVEFDLNYQ